VIFVMNPGSLWHHGFVGLIGSAWNPPTAATSGVVPSSGKSARAAHTSSTVFPLFTPPWNVSPFIARAVTFTSRPL